MRRFSVAYILLLWGVALPAQQTDPTVPAVVVKPATDEPEDRIAPPTPLEQHDLEIRQFDPLDQDDSKTGAQKAKDDKDKDKDAGTKQQPDSRETPLPGSVAASEAKNSEPQVVEGGGGGADSQQSGGYAGPAVLSHSYTINSSMVPENLQWTTMFGAAYIYDSGINAAATGPQGSIQNASGAGLDFQWGISGRHKFHRDTVGISYYADHPWYSSGNQYTGMNSRLAVDYTHVVTRRLLVKLTESANIFSQSYTLQNSAPGPETPIADINLATTSLPAVFDNGYKSFTTGISVTWQKSARMSYNASLSYFDNMYNNPALTGVAGEQAQGTLNYRFTSRTTAGLFYSYSMYAFPHGAGLTDSESLGFLYSYALNRSTRVQLRAGEGISETHAYETVPLNPVLANLFGLQYEVVDGYYRSLNQDISASLAKDFGTRGTVTFAYSKGISPGNGIFLAGDTESYAVTGSMRAMGRSRISLTMGRNSLTSLGQTTGPSTGAYVTDFVTISSSRPLHHNLTLNFGATYRYYQIVYIAGLRNELSLNCGFTWNHSEPRLGHFHW
jgi:hypothetical protein